MNKKFAVFIFCFSVLFTFQTLGVTAPRSNPKTCCGRKICMCKHAPGAPCPMKKHHHAAEKAAPEKTGFTKAPCHRETPKTVLPRIAQDYLPADVFQESAFLTYGHGFYNFYQNIFSLSDFKPLDHPPRTF